MKNGKPSSDGFFEGCFSTSFLQAAALPSVSFCILPDWKPFRLLSIE